MVRGALVILCRICYQIPMTHISIHCPDSLPPTILRQTLLAYDTQSSSAEFRQTSFSCSICFASLKGEHCIQLSCSHVFCVSCLQDYWGLCIEEGTVERVGCADPECVKAGREANEEEVRRVCGEKAVIRWKWLKVKKAVEKGACTGCMRVRCANVHVHHRSNYCTLPDSYLPSTGSKTTNESKRFFWLG